MNPNALKVPDSWHPETVLTELRNLARGKKVVVEVGTWLGHSALAMAESCEGHVYCVDHWRGSLSGTGTVDKPLALYELFLLHIREYRAGDLIVPLFGDSAVIAQLFTQKPIDLLYIDGDHSGEMVARDLKSWTPYLAPTGIVCGDDWLEVRGPVSEFFSGHPIKLAANNRLWIVEP